MLNYHFAHVEECMLHACIAVNIFNDKGKESSDKEQTHNVARENAARQPKP
jgi:hypothetical protein